MRSDRPRSTSRSAPRKVAMFIDHGGLLATESETLPTAVIAERVAGFAASLGRVAVSAAYADWTHLGDDAREYHHRGIETRLVMPHDTDDDRSDLFLSLDALEAVLNTPALGIFIIVSPDAGFREIAVRLRRMGREVIAVGPRPGTSAELRRSVDQFVSLESLKGGAGNRPVETAPEGAQDLIDFSKYDWSKFMRLIDELESRLKFVGLKYLNHKVLNRENCGFDDRARKQDLINHAVDEGILEIHRIDNIEAGGDPVSACRLGREHDLVKQYLGAKATSAKTEPQPAPEDEASDDA